MKTHHRHLLLASVLCLLTSDLWLPTPVEAATSIRSAKGLQSVRGATRRNARKNPNTTGEGPIANIDETWYLEFTPAYVCTTAAIGKFHGASLAFGWRITQEDSLQLEIGYYASANFSSACSYTRDGTDANTTAYGVYYYGGTAGNNNPNSPPYRIDNQGYALTMNGNRSAKAAMIPMLLSYNFCIWLDSPGRFELKLTPTVGFVFMSDTWNLHANGSFDAAPGTIIDTISPNDGNSMIRSDGSGVDRVESFSGHDSNYIASVMGGGFSFTYNFSPRWYVSAGYRYLWTGVTTNKQDLTKPTGAPWNGVNTWNGMNTHNYFATIGRKF